MRVLLISNSDLLALCAIRCLEVTRAEILLTSPQRFPPPRLSRKVRGYLANPALASPGKSEEAAGSISDYCRKNMVDMLIPLDASGTRTARAVKLACPDIMMFPAPKDPELSLLENKWTLYETFRGKGIPFPETILIERLEQLRQLSLEFPVLVKPLDLEGGLGIIKIGSLDELYAYFAGKTPLNRMPLLLQEYVPGRDVDLSILAINGRIVAWTSQERLQAGGLRITRDEEILETCKSIIADTAFTGLAHFDLRKDKRSGRILMLECNPRSWVTMRASMFYGVNFLQLGIDLAMGREVESSPGLPDLMFLDIYGLMRTLIAGWRGWHDINRPSLRGVIQILKDPLPYLYYELLDFTGKHIFRTRLKPSGLDADI